MPSIEIKNEDCFVFLKDIKDSSVDFACIDPPYEISRETNFLNSDEKGDDTDRFRMSMDFGDWDKDFSGLDGVIKEIYRVLKPGGSLVCFYDIWKISYLKEYIEKAGFKQIRFVEWVKTNPVPINSKITYLSNAREVAVSAVKGGNSTFNSEYDDGIYSFPICHDKGRFHPTQKPVDLIRAMIRKHSNEGDLVLDCFSGSGTTAVACYCENRNFIGCEISKEYYDKSIDRMWDLGIYTDKVKLF